MKNKKSPHIDNVTFNINTKGCLGFVADAAGQKKATLEINVAICSNIESLLGLARLLQTVKSWTVETLGLPGGGWRYTVRGEERGVTVSSAAIWGDTLDSLLVFLQPFNSWTIETLLLSGQGVCRTVRVGEEGMTVSRAVCRDDKAIHDIIKILNVRNSWTVDELKVKFEAKGRECAKCNKRPVRGGSPCTLHTLLAMQDKEKIVKNVIFK
jgi:hypothetical protein